MRTAAATAKRLLPAAMLSGAILLSACEAPPGRPANGAVVRPEQPPPSYSEVAQGYNARIAGLNSLFARTAIRIRYIDAEGNRQMEQGEGTLQVILPDRLALSLNKAGVRGFWFGGDEERYWWIDVLNDRVASVGRHENFDRAGRIQLGLAIHPLDMVRMLGILPLPEEPDAGRTQWSDDGALLGVTTVIRDGAMQRIWMDPRSFEPRSIELFDQDRRPVVVADLEMYAHMEFRDRAVGPRVALRVSVFDVATETEVRLTMDEVEDGARRITPAAFDFEQLRRTFNVDRVIDLDARAAMGMQGP